MSISTFHYINAKEKMKVAQMAPYNGRIIACQTYSTF